MADIESGTIIAGKYRVVQRLSRGGMGSVWLAHHLQLDAPVAIKFMRPSLLASAGARARFEREAKAAAQIRSPHVVTVYDHGIDGETPFIVMEYLEGGDLQHRLRGGKRLPPNECVRLCDEVCKGLYRAHRLGIVHRDLKPGNIWLSEPDDSMVKILDFGIAKETGDTRKVRGETTTTGQLLGSPHYMSPEQARGQKLDGRSDLWSLAVILFRSLTGKRPFDGNDIGDLIVRICMDPIPAVTSMDPMLPATVDEFFTRAFTRDQEGRFQDAREFAREFRIAMADALSREGSMADSGSWAGRGSAASLPDAREAGLLTPTPSSEKFGNIHGPMGPRPSETGTSQIGDDTFAAAAAPTRARTRVALGAIAALLIAAVVVAVLVTSGGESHPTAVAPPEEKPAPAASASPSPAPVEAPAPVAEAEPIATSSSAASSSGGKSRVAAPREHPRDPVPPAPGPRPVPPPNNAGTPRTPGPKKDPFGY